MKCCNEKMKMFGVTERGEYKYCCKKCYKIKLGPKRGKENENHKL